MILILVIAVFFLAYANGANDNFKGVATLFGSGTTSYRSAISWATITTLLGSLSAIFLASTLVKNFSGKGLVPDALIQSPEFAVSIALGAGLTVLLATKIGMPISTTHSLVGALFGSGVMAVGAEFNFEKLGSSFLVPLIVSPLMAAVVSLVGYVVFRYLRKVSGVTKESCVWIEGKLVPASEAIGANGAVTEVYSGNLLGISAQKVLDIAHYISAGVVSFARGLNDTPKMVGLLLAINAFDIKWGMIGVAIAISAGGLLNAKKVGVTVSKKITKMNHGQGFTANLFTGLLVTTASIHGMPVSTTHVSVGSIFGIGTITKTADAKVVGNILLSWLLTLPVGAICAGISYLILKAIM